LETICKAHQAISSASVLLYNNLRVLVS